MADYTDINQQLYKYYDTGYFCKIFHSCSQWSNETGKWLQQHALTDDSTVLYWQNDPSSAGNSAIRAAEMISPQETARAALHEKIVQNELKPVSLSFRPLGNNEKC